MESKRKGEVLGREEGKIVSIHYHNHSLYNHPRPLLLIFCRPNFSLHHHFLLWVCQRGLNCKPETNSAVTWIGVAILLGLVYTQQHTLLRTGDHFPMFCSYLADLTWHEELISTWRSKCRETVKGIWRTH